ncbi:MAG: glycosyltransferase family 4 protein [Bacteroidetes bacterium]|nr:glycosyltransferase family 4 protein [Bacteroidota bacterium]
MNSPKNILAIISFPFLPATTGGEISTMNILNYTAQQHQVTVFTVDPYSQNYKPESLHFKLIFGMRFKAWRYMNLGLIFTILKLIKQTQADYVFFDQPWLGWLMPFIKIFTRKKIYLRSNNIEYLRFKSMGKSWWTLLYMYEKFVYRMSDLVIFVSDVDQAKAIDEFYIHPSKTFLCPYGIEIKSRPNINSSSKQALQQRHSIESDKSIILFFSTLSYQPNYEAVAFIADEIYPRLIEKNQKFMILICGKNLPENIRQKLNGKSEIQYLGFVDDINEYIDGSDVMINPILSGGGVKTKAIDTLSRSQTVISTQTGAEGIDANVCGNNLQISTNLNWNAFTEKVIAHVKSGKSYNIPDDFYKTYYWPHIIERLSERLEKK